MLTAEGEADRGETISVDDLEKQIRDRRAKEDRRSTVRSYAKSFANTTITGFTTVSKDQRSKFYQLGTR